MIFDAINKELKNIYGNNFQLFSSIPLAGGDINTVYKLNTSEGSFCIKLNNSSKLQDLFEKEAAGLQHLESKSNFTLPKVIKWGTFSDQSYLLLSFIETGSPKNNYWELFGGNLAAMHMQSANKFGLEYDNYIGSLKQCNSLENDWASFYTNQRLIPQTKLALDKGLVDTSFLKSIENLCSKLEELFPNEPPALLHGDLWSGNFIIDSQSKPALIDPAIYYGHREMDLAMTMLFGGFHEQLYTVYNASYPLEKAWKDRVSICQLYPILVHVNLFGGSYINHARAIISNYQ